MDIKHPKTAADYFARNKMFYEYCEACEWDNEKIALLADEHNFSIKTIKIYARKYAVEYLEISTEKYLEQVYKRTAKRRKEEARSNIDDNKYFTIYRKLITLTNTEEILQVLIESGFDVQTLNYRILDFIILFDNLSREERGDLEENLKGKIKLYSEYLKDQRQELKLKNNTKKEESLLSEAKNIIEMFINGEYSTREEFCNNTNININTFDKLVIIIQKYDESLYVMYRNKIRNTQKQRYAIIMSKIQLIIEKIRTGIVENNVVRQFDLLDYYSITTLTFEEILRASKGTLNVNDEKLLRNFINKNRKDKPLNIGLLMETTNEINAKRDKEGFPIPGTGRIISMEEKTHIINHLKSKNIILTNKTYSLALERFINGILIDEELVTENKKIL